MQMHCTDSATSLRVFVLSCKSNEFYFSERYIFGTFISVSSALVFFATRYLFASFDTFPEMTFGKEGRGGGSHNLEVPEMAARTTFIEQ